jgi:hypothetical protein
MIGRKKDALENGSAYAQLKALAERQQAMERELASLSATVKSLVAQLIERKDVEARCEGGVDSLAASAGLDQQEKKPDVRREVAAVIAAATAFANGVVKVRKLKTVQPAQDTGSAWSQQGRVGVLGSHNLR